MAPSAAAFQALVHSRRSVRKFDAQLPFDHQAVQRSLQLALLAPNSSNMQLWEFHCVIQDDLRQQVAQCCFNQNAAKTARELVVFAVTPHKWRERAELNAAQIRQNFSGRETHPSAKRAFKYYERMIPALYQNDRMGVRGALRKLLSTLLGLKKPMMREVSRTDLRVCLHKSSSLAAMNFINGMRAEGYDTCAMEGYDSKRLKQLLGMDRETEITMVVGCGPRAEGGIYSERHRIDAETVIHTH
ncbi:nitroreductase family protein [Ferrimonas pelagia]|uniref:Nitroreductase family protein n=1 Tax=Ferrimonas pelagia TaxID=1177826 RepID=A0ABP9EZD5_9GAMM